MLLFKNWTVGLFLSIFFAGSASYAQNTPTPPLARPKLVVGIVVDQMRYDYLYRYYDKYGEGGFKRLLTEGFNCRNNHYPYALTVTAAGHSSVYTGPFRPSMASWATTGSIPLRAKGCTARKTVP